MKSWKVDFSIESFKIVFMKILLVGINASYSHTNLAIRTISEYIKSKNNLSDVEIAEFTINQPYMELIRGIASFKADAVLFSTYIWNAELTSKIIMDLKSVLPQSLIGAGGPEYGLCAEEYLKKLNDLDFIISGEGEQTVFELLELCNSLSCSMDFGDNKNSLKHKLTGHIRNVKGVYFKDLAGNIFYTGDRPLICDLSEIPFPYPEITDPDNKMYYYESSRGCPYSCAYCMSSLDKRVRFMPLERVYADLQKFLDANVRIVKFVDRTYNLNPERYIKIWEYILSHHNKKTMFHFEIEAEYLSSDALDFLQKVPEGVMQFEIGVQSSNPETLKSVFRSPDVTKLAENVKRIPRTIHQHLDLIAGLPYEDMTSFGKSLDFVMSLKPDALQLGFLKILHGTEMEKMALHKGWKWMKTPAYEVFSTPYMSYENILYLKDMEVIVDAFWNSGKFIKTMGYAGRIINWWSLFCGLVDYGRKNGIFVVQHRETFWFEFLCDWIKSECISELDSAVMYNLLKYDFVIRGKQGGFPSWYCHNYDKEKHRNLLEQDGGVTNARLDFAYSEYEEFEFDPETEFPENNKGNFSKLIKYKRR
ncbi:MAG: DUF4080 domain-containing protein [Treponema sp.]|nr:DUF4080 domain-containing protein [Treponema sp.]